jgi:large conductance mechanosensitive channel
MIIGGVDFTGLQVTLKAAEGAVPAVTLKYGAFLQQVFDFTIVAFAMFALIKGITQLKKREAAAAPLPTGQEVLLAEIRDILKSKSA